VLRATKLDELPQLVNVLRGEMSLVGPRPEDPCYLEGFPAELRGLFHYRPGITSPASVRYRHEEEALLREANGDAETYYREHLLPRKAALDLAYCQQGRSVRSDLAVLVATARSVLRARTSS
jgi:lipopolysaccharide/colanic/teichoic acid biosynthesis glycosyltransferase